MDIRTHYVNALPESEDEFSEEEFSDESQESEVRDARNIFEPLAPTQVQMEDHLEVKTAETKEPKVPETFAAEELQASIPEVPETKEPEASIPEVPETKEPEASIPEVPETKEPEAPIPKVPETPKEPQIPVAVPIAATVPKKRCCFRIPIFSF